MDRQPCERNDKNAGRHEKLAFFKGERDGHAFRALLDKDCDRAAMKDFSYFPNILRYRKKCRDELHFPYISTYYI